MGKKKEKVAAAPVLPFPYRQDRRTITFVIAGKEGPSSEKIVLKSVFRETSQSEAEKLFPMKGGQFCFGRWAFRLRTKAEVMAAAGCTEKRAKEILSLIWSTDFARRLHWRAENEADFWAYALEPLTPGQAATVGAAAAAA